MTDRDLARELVECPRFEWRVGMKPLGHGHVVRVIARGSLFVSTRATWRYQRHETKRWSADLADPATQGVLHAIGVELLPDGWSLYVKRYADQWGVEVNSRGTVLQKQWYVLDRWDEGLGHALAGCIIWLAGREDG